MDYKHVMERDREYEEVLLALPFSIFSFTFTTSLTTTLPGFSDTVPTAGERISLVLHGLGKGGSGSLVGRQLGSSEGFRANLLRLGTFEDFVEGLGRGGSGWL